MITRKPAVAGLFYPGDRGDLIVQVDRLMKDAEDPDTDVDTQVRALIAPHAGYDYSGPIAANAYRHLQDRCDIQKVLLLGPSHRVPFHGFALATADTFATPLGNISVDTYLAKRALAIPSVRYLDDAHSGEHSLEVHLPFLQRVLPGTTILPLVVGDTSPSEVETLFDHLYGDSRTLIVVSSDLSHFLDYNAARVLDKQTSQAIESLSDTVRPNEACGCRPLNGLLRFAEKAGWSANTIDVRNSGDTAGLKGRVVGYGAYAFR